jgi:hypothetical protein
MAFFLLLASYHGCRQMNLHFDLTMIVVMMQQAPPKGPVQLYDPMNFDESYATEYGGYTSMEGSGGRGGRGSRGGAPGMRGGMR